MMASGREVKAARTRMRSGRYKLLPYSHCSDTISLLVESSLLISLLRLFALIIYLFAIEKRLEVNIKSLQHDLTYNVSMYRNDLPLYQLPTVHASDQHYDPVPNIQGYTTRLKACSNEHLMGRKKSGPMPLVGLIIAPGNPRKPNIKRSKMFHLLVKKYPEPYLVGFNDGIQHFGGINHEPLVPSHEAYQNTQRLLISATTIRMLSSSLYHHSNERSIVDSPYSYGQSSRHVYARPNRYEMTTGKYIRTIAQRGDAKDISLAHVSLHSEDSTWVLRDPSSRFVGGFTGSRPEQLCLAWLAEIFSAINADGTRMLILVEKPTKGNLHRVHSWPGIMRWSLCWLDIGITAFSPDMAGDTRESISPTTFTCARSWEPNVPQSFTCGGHVKGIIHLQHSRTSYEDVNNIVAAVAIQADLAYSGSVTITYLTHQGSHIGNKRSLEGHTLYEVLKRHYNHGDHCRTCGETPSERDSRHNKRDDSCVCPDGTCAAGQGCRGGKT
ncbi:hypothetical protein PG989_013262 [Apiospora arundinis]